MSWCGIMPKSRTNGRSSIAKKKVGVIGNAPSKWCWLDCIGQILVSIAKAYGLLGGRYGNTSKKFPSKYRRS
jgi:hypothetical protein